jgi:hypothetical protein
MLDLLDSKIAMASDCSGLVIEGKLAENWQPFKMFFSQKQRAI